MPESIGFVGLGVMGRPMATQLLKAIREAGASLHVFSRTRSTAATLLQSGAVWADSASELGRACDVVVVMVPDLPEVAEVLEGDEGLVAGATTQTVVAVCSTVSPEGLRHLATRIAVASDGLVHVIDAPVSGGEEGAEDGTLSIMVGGETADVRLARPVLAAMGIPTHVGSTGAGQVAKACNQIVVAATLIALGEAAVLAERSSLDLREMFDVLQHGLANSRVLETKRKRFETGDYQPSGRASFMAKDLAFAVAEAHRTGLDSPHLELLAETFADLTAEGFGDLDTSAVKAYIESHRSSRDVITPAPLDARTRQGNDGRSHV